MAFPIQHTTSHTNTLRIKNILRSQCHQQQRRHVLVTKIHANPSYNPQNTDQPLVLPSIEFTPEQAVSAQLDALAKNDVPWPQHGIHTLYEWGLDIGGLDPSMYFGFPKDLYHLDHFMGQVGNQLPDLINLASYTIKSAKKVGDGDDAIWIVKATVVPSNTSLGEKNVEFHLKKKRVGARKGALMTAMILMSKE